MKALITKLVRLALIPLFPMVVVSASVLAEVAGSENKATCADQFVLTLDQARPHNERQLGLYFSMSDKCGQSRKLSNKSIEKVSLNNVLVPVWRLDWRLEESAQMGIHEITGINRLIIDRDSAAARNLAETLVDNRAANRVEIIDVKKGTTIQSSSPRKDDATDIIQSFSDKLLGGAKSVDIEIREKPSERLLSALRQNRSDVSLPGGIVRQERMVSLGQLNSTESRYFVRYLKHQLKNVKTSTRENHIQSETTLAFSEIDHVTFVDAEIIDRASGEPQTWRYRPEMVAIRTDNNLNAGNNARSLAEINGFLDVFETEVGKNVLTLSSEKLFQKPFITADISIETPDKTRYLFKIRVDLTDNNRNRYSCAKPDDGIVCQVNLSPNAYDMDLIANWNGKRNDSDLLDKNEEINRLFTGEDYVGCIQMIESIISIEQVPATIPIPVAEDWIFKNAESYAKLGQAADAAKWYRKIVREYPRSNHYSSAWYRLTDIHTKGMFRD